ncbi:endonuclease/exonuclease/phosphatase family protein [Halegenticoccus tardaugens]|uniref:endonuclease/exonuclease/phosphatase family protein n=1 Tax=Halegenticoccus tardaugens TaxID=2071624 RepID=UPI0013E953B0|nr:endonuclease/exonuclease/phosphatase family protein [Halegenticoccus tardaugens]
MSYNIRYNNPDDGTNIWQNRRDAVVSAIRFHNPDLIGLQEAWPAQLQDIREQLSQYEWRSPGETLEPGEFVALGYKKSRFTLQSEGVFWLSETPDKPSGPAWDAALPRLVYYAILCEQTTEVTFAHFNTHFDHVGDTALLESAKLMKRRIAKRASNKPVILTGDFNCRVSSPPYKRLTQRSETTEFALADASQASKHGHHGPSTTMTDFHALVPDKQLDHILVSDDIGVRIHGILSDTYENGWYPSDHLPVCADVTLPTPNE